jgi:hypothetical protein
MHTESHLTHSFIFVVRVLLAVMVLIMAGCGETEHPAMPVSISGSIEAPPGVAPTAKVFVSLYHAWSLEGDLRHAVQFIDTFETKIGPFSHEFSYPLDRGEGLLIYAWLDVDGDGVLCTPEVRIDIAGLTEVTGYLAEDVSADVQLVVPCAGPDWFYP